MHDEIYPAFGGLLQWDIDWLRSCGVSMGAIIRPEPIRFAHGFQALDGRFDHDPSGPIWLVFFEPEDVVFWRPRTVELATWHGRAFALGEHVIDAASTYALDYRLNIYSDPLTWLAHDRDGIVVVNWACAFDHLRDCPRVAIDEAVLPLYLRHMKPARLPEVIVRSEGKEALR
ncbi:hypothetical protein ACU8NW_10525 [Rhizobium leguminosarum]